MQNNKYEAVIGLEVHAQLQTASKAFSADPVTYGESPNTMVSPVSLGHPGTLPVLNKNVLNLAIKMGLACKCKIREENHFARKNYFYADLPKGYQITQHTTPICTEGVVKIKTKGVEKTINLTRIHIEEDAGKSIHDIDPFHTLIDLNRCGVPLIEIVSEPDLCSGDEAYQYLTEIRKLVRYLEICDGNMEEGSLRCDANISIRPKGSKTLGQKVEVKNMNSIRNVKRAIEHEIERQIAMAENGEEIIHETRSFDAVNGTTFSLRSKEEANDYRYFPEPDLPPVIVTQAWIEDMRTQMPPLPEELHQIYTTQMELSDYDAGVLSEEKPIALFFNELTQLTKNYKAAANWMIGPVKSFLNENAFELKDTGITPEQIAGIIQLIDEGKISFSAAAQKLFPELVKTKDADPAALAQQLNIIQESDTSAIEAIAKEALAAFPEKVEEYRSGKKGLLGLFMGEVMKRSKGKADPKVANQIVRELLEG